MNRILQSALALDLFRCNLKIDIDRFNAQNIFRIYLLGTAVLDSLSTILEFEIRIHAYWRLLFITLFVIQSVRNRFFLVYFLISLNYILFCLPGFWGVSSLSLAFYEIETYSRFLLLFAILAFFYMHRQDISREHLENTLLWYAIAVSVSLIYSKLFGVGLETYRAHDVYAVKGFFRAGNDISVAIGVGFSVFLARYFERASLLMLCVGGLIAFSMVLLGTRSGLIMLFAMVVFGFIQKEFRFKSSCWRHFLTKWFKVIIFSLLVGVSLWYMYLFLSKYAFLLDKLITIFEKNPRYHFVDAADSIISNWTMKEWLFGEGMHGFMTSIGGQINQPLHAVEQDTYDSLGAYGLMGLICILSPHIVFFFGAMKMLLSQLTTEKWIYVFTLVLVYFHAALAGHVFFSTNVAPFMAFLIYVIFFTERQKH